MTGHDTIDAPEGEPYCLCIYRGVIVCMGYEAKRGLCLRLLWGVELFRVPYASLSPSMYYGIACTHTICHPLDQSIDITQADVTIMNRKYGWMDGSLAMLATLAANIHPASPLHPRTLAQTQMRQGSRAESRRSETYVWITGLRPGGKSYSVVT